MKKRKNKPTKNKKKKCINRTENNEKKKKKKKKIFFPKYTPAISKQKVHQILGQTSLRAIGDFSIIVAGNIKKLYSLYE